MPLKISIRVLLAMSGIFRAGQVWWCEDCGRGGFAGVYPQRHNRRCAFLSLHSKA